MAFVWAFVWAAVLLLVLQHTVGMRVSPEAEEIGLNIAEHGATSSLIGLAQSMGRIQDVDTYDESLEVEVEHGASRQSRTRLRR